jgi:hypothetical protein
MPQSIQRPRYFDGEFLRSGDFIDEQSYHIEMRRLLNQQLHLSGIVTGLHLVVDQNSAPPVQFLSVAHGFAIDQIGREIYVPAPYSLTPLLSRAGLQIGFNEVWIVYTETPTSTPATGYQLCDQPSQNTRWTESFDLVLRSVVAAPPPNKPDPNHDLKGVCLGVVNLNYDAINGYYFSLPTDWYKRRCYAKLRAQEIIAPDDVEPDPITLDGPNVFPPDGYIRVVTRNGVFSEGNTIVRNNLLVGDDWTIQNTNPQGPAPAPTNPNGNLKLNSDIFLNGKIYTNVNGNWVDLDTHIKGLIAASPDIQIVKVSINCAGTTGTKTLNAAPVKTKLANFTSIDILASLSGIQFVNQAALNNWVVVNASHGALAQITNITPTPDRTAGTSATAVTITVSCDIIGDTSSGLNVSPFQSVDVALVVIFRP